jgi:hypothetical protein
MYRFIRPNGRSAPLRIPNAILWILIYFNLIHTTTELQTADYMYDKQPTLFPFNSDQESKTISMTQTITSTGKSKLASLCTAQGRSTKSKVKMAVMEGKPRGASKAAEGANKRDGETISTVEILTSTRPAHQHSASILTQ